MVHTDKIVREFELSTEGVIDFKEFLNVIKALFKKYGYDLTEKVYNSKTSDGLRNTSLIWHFDNKPDDYNQCIVKIKIKLDDYKEGTVDNKKVVDGKLSLGVDAEINRDYDQKWKTAPMKKFFRAIYDKYVAETKQDRVTKDLTKLVEELKKEIKQYLHI